MQTNDDVMIPSRFFGQYPHFVHLLLLFCLPFQCRAKGFTGKTNTTYTGDKVLKHAVIYYWRGYAIDREQAILAQT